MSSNKGRQERAGAAFSQVLRLRQATIKGGRSAGSGLPTKVLEGASRLGTYALLRLTALRLRESPRCCGRVSFENDRLPSSLSSASCNGTESANAPGAISR